MVPVNVLEWYPHNQGVMCSMAKVKIIPLDVIKVPKPLDPELMERETILAGLTDQYSPLNGDGYMRDTFPLSWKTLPSML